MEAEEKPWVKIAYQLLGKLWRCGFLWDKQSASAGPVSQTLWEFEGVIRDLGFLYWLLKLRASGVTQVRGQGETEVPHERVWGKQGSPSPGLRIGCDCFATQPTHSFGLKSQCAIRYVIVYFLHLFVLFEHSWNCALLVLMRDLGYCMITHSCSRDALKEHLRFKSQLGS